jgi:hypothetical protein
MRYGGEGSQAKESRPSEYSPTKREAMYACIHEIGSGFFEGVRSLQDRPLFFATHPYLTIGELTLAETP